MRKLVTSVLVACVVLCLPFVASAQSPEFDKIKEGIGEWDCKMTIMGMESKATASAKLSIGGAWIESDFKGDFGGAPFVGKGLDTYDTAKKKYVSYWFDSMSPSAMVCEGGFEGGKLVMTGTSPGADGKPEAKKLVTDIKSKDQQIFQMFTVGADGKETLLMTIDYRRKK